MHNRRRPRRTVARGLRLAFAAALALAAGLPVAAAAQSFSSKDYELKLVTVAEGLRSPWALAWLPDGRMLVTEKPGRLKLLSADGRYVRQVRGLPQIAVIGQGGLLDVAVDPGFADNRTIYFSYAEPGPGGAGTAVARAELVGEQLENLKVLFRQTPKTQGGRHFGSRLALTRDGYLFITVGERGERHRAQDASINCGQVIRLHTDGRIPADNPFVGRKGFRPETWSYGHRNPQGAALHPKTGKLWLHEHGAMGGDEINIPKPGGNYGWPVIAYGLHYSGGKIGVGTHKEGMEQPTYYWDPSIAPSGMAFYTGDKFPKWRGNLLVGALKFRLLARLTLQGEKVVGEERLLETLDERIRDVRQGPDGYIYLLTDARRGRLLRLEPR